MVSATTDGQSRRGRKGGVTPKYINEEQIVWIPPGLVEVGHILSDGMVLEIDIRYSEDTGQPTEYHFETPHCLVYARPGDEVVVYARVQPEIAAAVQRAHEQEKAR